MTCHACARHESIRVPVLDGVAFHEPSGEVCTAEVADRLASTCCRCGCWVAVDATIPRGFSRWCSDACANPTGGCWISSTAPPITRN